MIGRLRKGKAHRAKEAIAVQQRLAKEALARARHLASLPPRQLRVSVCNWLADRPRDMMHRVHQALSAAGFSGGIQLARSEHSDMLGTAHFLFNVPGRLTELPLDKLREQQGVTVAEWQK